MKAIALDMYGVIIRQTGDDFVPYVQKRFPALRPEEILEPWFQADRGELTSLEVWEKLGFTGDLEQVEKEYLDTLQLNDGVREFISAAQKQYQLAIISNDSSRWSRYLREKFGLNPYFDVISISGDLRMQKPDRGIFELTLQRLGCQPSQCFYIDDRLGNLLAAGELGMKPILFGNLNPSYKGETVMNFGELGRRIL